MKKILLMTAVSAAALAGMISSARADIYVLENPDYRLTFSYPDRWEKQGGLTAPDIFRLVADGTDKAECTVSTKTDRRFVIYPRNYMDDVVNTKIDKKYWEKHFANVDNIEYEYEHEAGLGHGDARTAKVNFDKTVGNETIRKTAIVFASLYGDQQIVVQCEANEAMFGKYRDVFGSIVGSVEFKPKYQPKYIGMYRDFLTGKDDND